MKYKQFKCPFTRLHFWSRDNVNNKESSVSMHAIDINLLVIFYNSFTFSGAHSMLEIRTLGCKLEGRCKSVELCRNKKSGFEFQCCIFTFIGC